MKNVFAVCSCAFLVLLACGFVCFSNTYAQDSDYDPSWYNPSQPYVKIAVAEDGIYQVRGSDLAQAGASLGTIEPNSLRLFKNGIQIPLVYEGDLNIFTDDSAIIFVGKRNQGTNESWAYLDPAFQSSTYNSLYTDTTYYWLTWGLGTGLRYRSASTPPLPNAITTFRDTLFVETDNNYYPGDGDDTENPFYTRGEGYYWSALNHNANNRTERNFSNVFRLIDDARTGAPEDSITVRAKLNGRTPTPFRVQLDLQTRVEGNTEFRTYGEVTWTGYDFAEVRGAAPGNEIPNDNQNRFRVRLISFNDTGTLPHQSFIDFIHVSYIRNLTAVQDRLDFGVAAGGGGRFTVNGFTPNTRVFVLNPRDRWMQGLFSNANGEVTFSAEANQPTTFWTSSRDSLLVSPHVSLDAASDLTNVDNEADYLILTTAMLHPSAEAFAAYRGSQGGHQTMVVDVQDVYDQFDYGRPTPLAIRRFLRATRQWRTPVRYVMLWGDALYPDRSRPRPPWEVISYGFASSDGWFAMQGDGVDDWTEFVAIGRIPIRDNETGELFLQKAQTYDAAPLDTWNKKMIMMVGSRDAGEQAVLGSHINRWSARAIAPPTGMDTTLFVRTVTEELPPDPTLQDSIRVAFRSGTSWLCYFGHSAAVTWDIVVDPPAQFNNAERLPVAMSLGCRTGAFAGGANVDNDVPVLAEDLVVGSLHGAIAHWGTSGRSSISASARLSDEVHELVFGDTLRVIGEVFQEAKRRYATSGAFSLRDLAQFGLIGDPATPLTIPVKPDLVAAPELIRIEPLAPVPADSQLTVTVTPRNLGLVPSGPVTFRLLHTTPSGTILPFDSTVTNLDARLTFVVRIDDTMVGTNRFTVQVDPENVYDEASEFNNMAETSHVVFSTDVDLIAPRHLSAITGPPLSLRLAFPPKKAEGTRISFELDRSPSFDSPNLLQFEEVFTGGFAIWEIDEALPTEQPYYWRARINDPDELTQWQESVFYLKASGTEQAWQQTATFFDRNVQDQFLTWDGSVWSLNKDDREVQLTASGNSGLYLGRFLVDGVSYEGLGIGYGILIMDGYTGEVRSHASLSTYPNTAVDDAQQRAVLDSLLATANEGDYILARSRFFRQSGPTLIEEEKAPWRALGSTAIDTLTHNDLWLMITRAGHPEETWEMAFPYDRDIRTDILKDTTFFFLAEKGATLSPRIGPASRWETMNWEGTLPNDDSEIQVAVLNGETQEVLLDSLGVPGVAADLSAISAQDVPFLRLRATLRDSSRQATPQLTRWAVDYTTVPEVVLDPAAFTLSADTLREGDVLNVSGALLNLSDQATDTVLVELRLTDAQNRTSVIGTDTLATLPALGTASSSFTIQTEGLVGTNRLTLEADQLGVREPVSVNNIAFTEFTVRGDEEAPTLTVTVEGERLPHDPEPVRDLQSPDIPVVSAMPTFEIVFADDNPFKLLQDTTLANITLENVTENITREVYFQSPDVLFEPATEERNEARIVYTPDFTDLNAVFTLRVRAFDVVGNEAEGSPYQVHFRVITASEDFSISSLYPYPNPMGEFTRFAFELRGSDPGIVDDLRIRIYTLTGRVVREFNLVENPSLLEGGGLRIGWNKMFWDGTDEDGDKMATGVYLYKVFMRAEGEEVQVNDAAVEKLVVLR